MTKEIMDSAGCACRKVDYMPISNADGSYTEQWMCLDCKSIFVRKKIEEGIMTDKLNMIIKELEFIRLIIGGQWKLRRDSNEDSMAMDFWHKKLNESAMWEAIREAVARFCFLGMKLENIVFCEEERPVCGMNYVRSRGNESGEVITHIVSREEAEAFAELFESNINPSEKEANHVRNK